MHPCFDSAYLFASGEEKPLDSMAVNGGFARIIRSFGVIGDSLSSGEYELRHPDCDTEYIDVYEQSWPSYLGRLLGADVHNFSRGGMTAQEYIDTWASQNRFWEAKCQAYFLALGVNDLFFRGAALGTAEDVQVQTASTFAGQIGIIVERYRQLAPDSRFFFVTMPKGQELPEWDEKADAHAHLMRQLPSIITNSYVIDLRLYAPCHDAHFRQIYYLNGHLNPCGYLLTADMMATYLDYIVRHNPDAFRLFGLEK